MSKIKTKATVQDIKVLDKAASGTAHAKNTFIRSKDSAEKTTNPQQDSPSEYASDNISGKSTESAHLTANRFRNPQQKLSDNVNKVKEHFKKAKSNLPKHRKQAAERAKKTADTVMQTADSLKGKADKMHKTAEQAKETFIQAKQTLRQTRQTGKRSIEAAKKIGKGVKTSGKSTVKAVKKSIKTTERTAKVAVKTAKQTAKTTRQSAKIAEKSVKLAAQASKAATKAAVTTAKAAVKATTALVKATIAAVKGLVALIVAGGWIAVLVIIIICLIGLLVGSVFGVFFSGESTGATDALTIPAVVSQLNSEVQEQIEEIKNENIHDILELEMASINWPEILSIYAVKINTDSENPREVVTLDDKKIDVLRNIYNDMISLSHSFETETHSQTTIDDDGNETTEEVSITILKIALNQKDSKEMAIEYSFNESQIEKLYELLSPQYNDMWTALLPSEHCTRASTPSLLH